MKLQCVKLTCEGILISGLATIFHVVERRRKKNKKGVCSICHKMDSCSGFYCSIVMEISSSWVSTVIVGKRDQCIILCKEAE